MSDIVKKQIDELRDELRRHNRLYYVEARPEISDFEFDTQLKKLEQLETEYPQYDSPDSPTHKVGGEPIDKFQTVPHRIPMLSISNIYNENELDEFDARIQKLLSNESQNSKQSLEYTLEYKIDGAAISLTYEDGILTTALTRGDGQNGDDVTSNARTMLGLPLKLITNSPPAILEIRGEALIANSDFATIRDEQQQRGEQPFANPRNATAGALKLLDPKQCAARKIRFLAHGIGYTNGFNITNHFDYLQTIAQMGIPITPNVVVCSDKKSLHKQINFLIENLHTLNFEVDGIVVKINQFATRKQLGYNSKFPRWAVAYKWEKYESATQVENITIQVGKTGKLTPVAHLQPVEIAGTTVSRASLHNNDEINRLGIKIGDWAIVEKAGKIIPHVVRIEEHRRDGTEKTFQFPTNCPECQTETVREETGVDIRCPNPNCPAQLRESLQFFASRTAMDIDGLGQKLIEQLIAANFLANLSDIYKLEQHVPQLLKLERVGEKSIDNLLAGIEQSKTRPLWRLLTGLNIRHVGTSNARILAETFGSIDEIAQQTVETLNEINDIGPAIAESVHTFFHSEWGTRLIEELRQHALNFGTAIDRSTETSHSETDISKADAPKINELFAGKKFVVTGTLQQFTRDEIKELIHQHGGKASGSISRNTDFLIAGEKAGSKLKKANELGIPILSEEQFLKQIKSSAE